jgi:DUF4097 and DUF4098 domain-containing protein YvlB
VHTRYSQSAPSVCEISIISHNGGIELVAPPNFSAAVKVSTHNGSIRTDLPIKVTGELSKHKIEGTIGAGDGKLYLETYNGSVAIR